MAIHYLVGDATEPQGEPPYVIAHVCNDVGAWGAGFVMALSKKWPEPEAEYRRWFSIDPRGDKLGQTQFVFVKAGLHVANMVAQRGFGGTRPLRYYALMETLAEVSDFALGAKASIHMPRIGCGLAGGTWENVEEVIIASVNPLVDVYVYDLKP